ncbi:hypothetical protein AzCIB_4633 [Azoarcus sp. CIB]|uniref:DUF4863 family protein n=1 Tax=Aromatoleum sp. (strain CIB) TaxID=198107 RepID=UPI000234A110|nr:DUF4863 family protein [Azoarcus sp. CIB]AKU14519.1 hypothetical protein AzCIB_4633 [Azoarcus sp. CIB]CCD33118.1 hypothetical protein [Azoarcus sp. CIB]
MTPDQFQALIAKVTGEIAGRPLDGQLADFLNERFPATGAEFQSIAKACSDAVAAGWMCEREHGGIKFGRVIKPTEAIHGFSVDVVEMQDLVGPQHAHPNGEIDMIMPLEGDAKFDGHGAGWFVYGPGSVHRPTVSDGRAYVLYLLPQGAIEFTKS